MPAIPLKQRSAGDVAHPVSDQNPRKGREACD